MQLVNVPLSSNGRALDYATMGVSSDCLFFLRIAQLDNNSLLIIHALVRVYMSAAVSNRLLRYNLSYCMSATLNTVLSVKRHLVRK